MKDGFFEKMRSQMLPPPSVEASLRYKIKTEKKQSASAYVVRWVPAAASVLVSGLLVFNMTMPATAEQLPIVGKAFERLNETGKEAREKGKTPDFLIEEENKEPFSVSFSDAECNGLDLVFTVEIWDNENQVEDSVSIITLLGSVVEVNETILYPTREAPRLSREADGAFRGRAMFNASPIAASLQESESIEVVMYCEDLNGFAEGATFEEMKSRYLYEFSLAKKFSASVDLSALTVHYLGAESDGLYLEYLLQSGDRTDIIYSVDESVEYAECFSVYTDSASPDVISMNSVKDANGRYVYNATFIEGGKDMENDAEGEVKDDYCGSISLYSNATGELYRFEEVAIYEEEVEE